MGEKRVKLNVGGKIFETNSETISSAGPDSLLANLTHGKHEEVFVDADPEIFSVLLRILRTGRIYQKKLEAGDRDALIEQAQYFGVVDAVRMAMAPPMLDGIDVEKVGALFQSGRDYPSAMAAGEDGSIWIAHGSKISAYDWALRKQCTTLTEFHAITSLNRISDTMVAAGALDLPGLHIYDVINRTHVKSFTWSDPEDPRIFNPAVQALASSDAAIFSSFLTGQKMANALLMVDKSTMQVVLEFGRQTGTSAGYSKAATKLQWISSKNLLMAVGVHGGAFGFSGYSRLWDVRANKVVWEWVEPNVQSMKVVERDSFSDMIACEELSTLFKVSVGNGSLAMADLRKLDMEDPWKVIEDSNPSLQDLPSGPENKLLCYNKQVFCSRGNDVEVWSELSLGSAEKIEERERFGGTFRRNFLEHSRRHAGHEIVDFVTGGNRLFIARDELQGVEIWETKFGSA